MSKVKDGAATALSAIATNASFQSGNQCVQVLILSQGSERIVVSEGYDTQSNSIIGPNMMPDDERQDTQCAAV